MLSFQFIGMYVFQCFESYLLPLFENLFQVAERLTAFFHRNDERFFNNVLAHVINPAHQFLLNQWGQFVDIFFLSFTKIWRGASGSSSSLFLCSLFFMYCQLLNQVFVPVWGQ